MKRRHITQQASREDVVNAEATMMRVTRGHRYRIMDRQHMVGAGGTGEEEERRNVLCVT